MYGIKMTDIISLEPLSINIHMVLITNVIIRCHIYIIHRRDLQLLTFMYNESLNTDNLNRRSHNILLRSSNKIKVMEKLTCKTSVQNSPYYRGIALWNCLSESLQKEPLVKFKNNFKGTYRNKNIRK